MRARFLVPVLLLSACGRGAPADQGAETATPATAAATEVQDSIIPPGADDANARLAASPRHGEWVMIPAGGRDSVRAWVVYPERSTKAPVVVVVHEIFGMSNWVRAVADQVAADGYIAVAPDLLTGRNVPETPEVGADPDVARREIATLQPADVQRRIDAAARYGMSLPAAEPRYAIMGFCWGGSTTFEHAVHSPDLAAAVVFYGTTPDTAALDSVRAPVLGLYGGDDARVDATIPAAETTLGRLGRTYQKEVFPGAGHGFMRDQKGRDGANLAAARAAWPRTLQWLRTYLEG